MTIRKILNKTLIAAGIMLFAMMGTAGAGSKTFITEESSLFSILDLFYESGNYERVSDDLDQFWTSLNGEVEGVVKQTTNTQTFGYIDTSNENRTFNELFTVPGELDDGFLISFTGNIPPGLSIFEFALKSKSNDTVYEFSSDPAQNDFQEGKFFDHMVTFKLLRIFDEDTGDHIIPDRPTYVIAWEGLPPDLWDQDYSDLIVEIRGAKPLPEPHTPIPEPHTMLLLGLGLMVLAMAKRAKRRVL